MNRTELYKKAMLDALESSLGVVTSALKIMKKKGIVVGRTTFYDWLRTDEEFKAQVDDIKEVTVDFAETKLHSAINNGNVTAIIFYLKTQGKKRGYIEKQEIDHTTNGESINSTFDLSKLSTPEIKLVMSLLEKAGYDDHKANGV